MRFNGCLQSKIGMKTPELFRLVYYESEFTRDPLDITVTTQICLPDGIVLDNVVHDNLERFISTRFPVEDLARYVAKNISCQLVEDLRQALEFRLAKSIDEKLKHYGERTIFQMPGMREENPEKQRANADVHHDLPRLLQEDERFGN